MAAVAFEHVRKEYGSAAVVEDFDLEVAEGELLVLLGGSGSGKSTTLRMVAGLESVSAGRILIAGRDVTGVAARDRDVAMVFQDYALYPHLTARENIALGLRIRRVPGVEIERRVRWAAEALELGALLDRKPRQLSGGQRQRVAMGRAMVREPRVFLFDEPLSNLDAQLRAQMRLQIGTLQRRLGTTTLYVTHDQVEAMTLADRLVVLDRGRIQQVGRPLDVYREPANRLVAGFLGHPPMNFVEGRVEERAGAAWFRSDALSLPLAPGRHAAAGAPEVTLGIRPEDLALAGEGEGGQGALAGVVAQLEVLGASAHVHVSAGACRLVALAPADAALAPGQPVRLRPDPRRVHLFAPDGRALRA